MVYVLTPQERGWGGVVCREQFEGSRLWLALLVFQLFPKETDILETKKATFEERTKNTSLFYIDTSENIHKVKHKSPLADSDYHKQNKIFQTRS